MTSRRGSRFRVGAKFAAAIGAVLLGVLSVAGVGAMGINHLQSDIDRLVAKDVSTLRAVGDLVLILYETEETALRELTTGAEPDAGSSTLLDQVLLPGLRRDLVAAQRQLAGNPDAVRRLTEVGRYLDGYLQLRRTAAEQTRTAAGRAALVGRVTGVFNRMTDTVRAVRVEGYAGVGRSGEEARSTYTATRRWLGIGTLFSLLVALTVVLLLVRDLVPRLRSYARFAAGAAAGGGGRLHPRGSDELADLGRALDDMVCRTEALRRQDADQAEFADTLQVTATEDEAHELVQRHLERSLPGAGAVVLKRNNSENRLEAATALVPGSALAGRLPGAEPRACLALRFGRTHREGPDRAPLLGCELCGAAETRSTCEPLLVGGQVIGSVQVTHADPLDADAEARIRTSVAQAAPVLANLRNLALAEFRANNDSLTGLPNKRATDDTLKRMVAQANRSITPLAAAMLDLDHFKQVNDRFGHAKGDEVLAAVGAALRSALRAGDFAGRYGGEELLVLLPDTTAEGAVALAERIRGTISALTVPGVDRSITVSIGIADLIQHGGDAPGLLRQADRALYTAKALGRNRVVVAPLADDRRPAPGPAGDDAPDRDPGLDPDQDPGRDLDVDRGLDLDGNRDRDLDGDRDPEAADRAAGPAAGGDPERAGAAVR